MVHNYGDMNSANRQEIKLVLQGLVKSGFLTPQGSNRGPRLDWTTYWSDYKHLEQNNSKLDHNHGPVIGSNWSLTVNLI